MVRKGSPVRVRKRASGSCRGLKSSRSLKFGSRGTKRVHPGGPEPFRAPPGGDIVGAKIGARASFTRYEHESGVAGAFAPVRGRRAGWAVDARDLSSDRARRATCGAAVLAAADPARGVRRVDRAE